MYLIFYNNKSRDKYVLSKKILHIIASLCIKNNFKKVRIYPYYDNNKINLKYPLQV